jgi:hypothetical protein
MEEAEAIIILLDNRAHRIETKRNVQHGDCCDAVDCSGSDMMIMTVTLFSGWYVACVVLQE